MDNEILLIDDDHKVLEILEESLKRQGYRVNTASNGRQALKLFETQNPQLVVIDMMLPDMNGLEVMAQLRESPRLADVPVMVLSANADADVRQPLMNTIPSPATKAPSDGLGFPI